MAIVKQYEISVNWLLNQVIGTSKTDYQITKIDNNQLLQFITFLKDNPLTMPDGSNALSWIRRQIALRFDQILNKMSKEHEQTRQRYRYILSELDLVLSQSNVQYSANEIIYQPRENKHELNVSFK